MNQASEHDLQLGKWLGGAALGALVMYMLDPDRGAPRRALSGEKLRHLGRQTGDALEKVVQGLSQRTGTTMASASDAASGAMAQSPTPATPSTPSETGGSRLDGASRPLAKLAHSSLLHAGQPWTPGVRSAALLGGSTLGLASIMTRRMPIALVLGLAGAALLTRSTTNRSLRGMLGMKGSGQTVDIEKTIRIDASPEQVYDLWANYENFPRFMANVVEVRDLGDRRSHWIVKGPANTEFEFDALLTEQSRPRRLAWESVPGSEVEQFGSVEFEPSRGGTRATVRMSYSPPAGAVGKAVATLFGGDPESELEEDLGRMKDLVEGRTPRTAQQGGTEGKFLH